jgi:type II secretory pathway component PulF
MGPSVKMEDIALTTRRMADLMKGGLPLLRSLEILEKQTRKSHLVKVIRSFQADLKSGKSFSQAVKNQNGFFPPFYAGFIQAGESTGSLESNLEEIAKLSEETIEIHRRVKAALAYPLFLLGTAVMVCLFLVIFVIPRFQFIFEDLGQSLPLSTRFLISLATTLKNNLGAALFLCLGVAALGVWRQREIMDRLKWGFFRLPRVRDWAKGVFLERWAKCMGSFLRGGFTVLEAMELCKKVFDGPTYSDEFDKVRRDIVQGRSLGEALGAVSLFPSTVIELVLAGEESGRLEFVFERIGDIYHRETEFFMKLAMSFFEPALIVFMGLLVGGVALAMLVPIFEMSGSIR